MTPQAARRLAGEALAGVALGGELSIVAVHRVAQGAVGHGVDCLPLNVARHRRGGIGDRRREPSDAVRRRAARTRLDPPRPKRHQRDRQHREERADLRMQRTKPVDTRWHADGRVIMRGHADRERDEAANVHTTHDRALFARRERVGHMPEHTGRPRRQARGGGIQAKAPAVEPRHDLGLASFGQSRAEPMQQPEHPARDPRLRLTFVEGAPAQRQLHGRSVAGGAGCEPSGFGPRWAARGVVDIRSVLVAALRRVASRRGVQRADAVGGVAGRLILCIGRGIRVRRELGGTASDTDRVAVAGSGAQRQPDQQGARPTACAATRLGWRLHLDATSQPTLPFRPEMLDSGARRPPAASLELSRRDGKCHA